MIAASAEGIGDDGCGCRWRVIWRRCQRWQLAFSRNGRFAWAIKAILIIAIVAPIWAQRNNWQGGAPNHGWGLARVGVNLRFHTKFSPMRRTVGEDVVIFN